MRYLLYDSERGGTLLSQEIEFMKNYIALMKLRLSPKVDLKISFPELHDDLKIPPLLFIPFIENAFKHGISHREPSFINILMDVDKKKIVFSTENSIGKNTQASVKDQSGIGLDNVKKRLALLFSDNYQLDISQTDAVFSVKLTIENI